MILQDFSRIEQAIDTRLLRNTKIVGVGAGGAYCLYDSLTRFGLRQLTVLDFDVIEEANIVRQGYLTSQLDRLKVEALGEHLRGINEGLNYTGITKNFLDMHADELDAIFGDADLFLFLTDSFQAQSYGNILALHYGVPAIWAGFYERSRCAEIVFTIPGVTPACFRCGVSPRYKAQAESSSEIQISSACNTMLHSQLLDAHIGMIVMAILHNKTSGYEFSNWFGTYWDRSLFQIKVHPDYGTEEESLFERTFRPTQGRAFTFNTIWQKVSPERPPLYHHCPDCGGSGNLTDKKMSMINQLTGNLGEDNH